MFRISIIMIFYTLGLFVFSFGYVLHRAFRSNDYEIMSILPHIMGKVEDISIFINGMGALRSF